VRKLTEAGMSDSQADRVRMAELTGNRQRRFDLRPDSAARAALAAELGLLDLPELRFEGTLRPKGKSDVELAARLQAHAVQPCVVTLAPVPCRIDAPVTRLYLADMPVPEGDEVEMPEDDTREAMPDWLDLSQVMAEALALALPDYPRAEGVELGQAVFAPPGVAPLTDAALNPFAALAVLKGKAKD